MTDKQEKLLATLLSQPTIEKAATAAGISEATALRYLKEPEFVAAYRNARREVVNHALTALQRGCSDAVTTLLAVANDAQAPASSRVSAAKAILESSIRAVELDDFGARLEALEEQSKEKD